MEKSKNYNFNLPNSANDEIADINDISDNFRIIDEIMNETDQTFEPTSTKAASGKAVNEAISGIQPIDENTEFVFDGGDVDGGVSVDIVVDTVLSKTSNNPIANKPVAIKFSEILGAIEQAKKDILLSVYPVGAFFMSIESTSPETLFGGTWVQIKDTFLLAAGDTYRAGTTGGAKEHSHNIDPDKAYAQFYSSDGTELFTGWRRGVNSKSWDSTERFLMNGYSTSQQTVDGGVGVYGTSDEANNMPPYLAVYVWQRMA